MSTRNIYIDVECYYNLLTFRDLSINTFVFYYNYFGFTVIIIYNLINKKYLKQKADILHGNPWVSHVFGGSLRRCDITLLEKRHQL